jgi:hypothetical protein
MKVNPLPDLNYLKECFEIDNDFDSGLKWKTRPTKHFKSDFLCSAWNKRFSTKQAGFNIGNDYYSVSLNYKQHLCHRIVYALHNNTTDFHGMFVDHKNGNTKNNNPLNLRLANLSQNKFNSKLYKSNKSGHKNISYCEKKKKFKIRITQNNKSIFSKSFLTLEEAIEARNQKIKELAGEFYRII